MIKLGTNNIGKIYLGSNPIGKAYLGGNLVFQSGGSPTPPGPEPSVEPVFYDRLVFDGTAYIETDIIPDANASYKVSVGDETLHAAQRLFITPATNTTNIGIFLGSSTTSTRRVFSVYYGASSAVSTSEGFNFATAERYNLWLTPNHFGWGDQSHSITRGENTPSDGLILGSNTSHTGQPFTGTMGVFYIYGSDAQNATSSSDFSSFTPVYTLRPCTYNGEAGMWCEETSTFYGNSAGAGTLSVLNNS